MVITKNKKAYWEYTILNEYVTGIVLVGSELKPLINNKVSLNESYCIIDNDARQGDETKNGEKAER